MDLDQCNNVGKQLHGHTHAHHSCCFYRHSVVNRAMANIWTPQQKVQCVLWLAEEKSVTWVHVRRTWNMDPPGHKAILKWDRTLRETGSKHAKRTVSEDTVERVRTAFARSPQKSIRRASIELQIPKSTIHKVMHKRLHLYAYKIQLRHQIKPNDRPLRANFASEMLLRIENDNSYRDNIVFSDEATFHFPNLGEVLHQVIMTNKIEVMSSNRNEGELVVQSPEITSTSFFHTSYYNVYGRRPRPTFTSRTPILWLPNQEYSFPRSALNAIPSLENNGPVSGARVSRPTHLSSQPEGSTQRAIAIVIAIFLSSVLALIYIYMMFPELEKDEVQYVKIPWDIEDAKKLGNVLDHYKDKYFFEVNRHRDNITNYIIFLRITPFLPNWFINIAAPIIDVPLKEFWIGTFVGVAPPSFLAIQAGQTLHTLSSTSQSLSWYSVILLAIFAIGSVVPVYFRKQLKDAVE
ncbi:hypothetical protein C0J52_17401 [Blattella germanica]|nr:hypothetical protein C0J52_17401 [Blattella germanica]